MHSTGTIESLVVTMDRDEEIVTSAGVLVATDTDRTSVFDSSRALSSEDI